MIKDFVVNIQRLTTAIQQKGFGLILILDDSTDHPYTVYTGVEGVAVDFAETTEAYKLAAKIFSQTPAPQSVAIAGTVATTEADLVTELNTILETNDAFFGLVCTDNSNAAITALSGWADSVKRMYAVTSQDLTAPTLVNSDYTYVMYHNLAEDFVAEGLLAYMLTVPIGSATAKFKQVNGSLASNITTTELLQLHTDNGFSYVEKYGVAQTSEGKVTSGEYIDVILGEAWIRAKMEEELAILSLNTPKIPYTNAGISLLVDVAKKVLKLATEQDIIAVDDAGVGQYEVSFLAKENVPSADIASRTYDYVEWTAVLSGAIHQATINGFLTL